MTGALPSTAQTPLDTQRLTVDLAASEGPVQLGANGALYGLGDDGVPSDAALEPLKITSVSQKPDGGLQHPNGDAQAVSKAFFRNGGGEINVMMQDIYAKWPYEDLGIDDYLPKVDSITRRIAADPNSERFVYIPFNEPDFIWYKLNGPQAEYEVERDRFLTHWKTVYERIHAIDPDAVIAGPNETGYYPRFLRDFLTFAKRENVLPQIMTWHELNSGSLRDFQGHYDNYRALERELGIGPLKINIDEYANRRDLSVPGQLVQWISMFERNKVYANMAYWDAAGNLSGHVVRSNIPNGGWWLFRWYAGLTGDTVKVTPPQPNTIDTLQGLASLDTSRRQAQVLLGGSAGDADVVVQNVPRKLFGRTVTATVAEAGWSGYEGQHAAPQVLSRVKAQVAADGTVTVPLRGLHKMSAYRIVLTPSGTSTPTAPAVPWSASYEAEDAAITGGTVYTQGTVQNANGYAASGTKDVGSLNTPASKVDFTVTVPEDGTYDLAVLYGNQSGRPATQKLSVDGSAPVTVTYPSTQNWTYRAKQDVSLQLTSGTHVLSLAKGDAEVTLDRIDLTRRSATPTASYEATLADISGRPAYDYASSAGTGTGSLVLRSGDKAVFDVYAPRDGYYTVVPKGSGPVQLALHGEKLAAVPNRALRLYLVAGNNRVAVTSGHASLRSLDVSGDGSDKNVLTYSAADAVLAGGAKLVDSAYAPGGAYIGSLGNSPDSTAEFRVNAPKSGRYLLVVTYAHNDRRDNGHAYNTDIMSRTANVTVDAGAPRTVTFKNTWSTDDYWTVGVPVELRKGANTVTFGNATAAAPDIARIELGRVVTNP
ncbi:CBM35 domain-containing protein [Streptomyces acidiscabies]|uniref:CBM35 domain-containing protein n=1 Tax=Streptomyces acidiscabies TaxID=42234 RepID=UPI00095159C2|nr:CBM35 domain-containing protein [Streptomyces acidiscabies]